MRKGSLMIFSGLLVFLMVVPLGWGKAKSIKIGINAPITGDIPKVGEGTKFAAQMWLEDIQKAGGLDVGGKKVPVELIIEDNESKADSAVKVNTKTDHPGRGPGHRRPPGLQAGGPRRRGGQQLQDAHDQPVVHQPRHDQEPPLRLPGLFPGPVPGAGPGQLHHGRIQVQQGGGPLRRCERLSQGVGRVLQVGVGEAARCRIGGGLRELYHQGRRFQHPADQDHQLRGPGPVHPPVLQ